MSNQWVMPYITLYIHHVPSMPFYLQYEYIQQGPQLDISLDCCTAITYQYLWQDFGRCHEILLVAERIEFGWVSHWHIFLFDSRSSSLVIVREDWTNHSDAHSAEASPTEEDEVNTDDLKCETPLLNPVLSVAVDFIPCDVIVVDEINFSIWWSAQL